LFVIGSVAKSTRVLPPLVVVARIVLLLVAAALAISGFALAWGGDHAAHAGADYVCPMHPEVTSATPAECPICRMELEQVTSARVASAVPAATAAAVHPPGTYVCPMHPEITARAPGRCPTCRMALEPAPAGSASAVTPSTNGANVDTVGHEAPYAIAAAHVEKPPDLIGRPVRRAMVGEATAPAWIEPEREAEGAGGPSGEVVIALLYNDDVPGLTKDTIGTFFLTTAPTEKLAARFTGAPPVARDESMSKVRFRLETKRQEGMPASAGGAVSEERGWLMLSSLRHERLTVPVSALLYSSGGPYVLVVSADSRTFQKRPVVSGRIEDGFAAVLSGLSAEERIIVGNTFALDAERRLQQRGETGEVKP
jgi:hypothetical protein